MSLENPTKLNQQIASETRQAIRDTVVSDTDFNIDDTPEITFLKDQERQRDLLIIQLARVTELIAQLKEDSALVKKYLEIRQIDRGY